MYLGELDKAESLLAQAMQILETNDDVPDMTPSVFYNLGYVAREKGLQTAESFFERALRASELSGTLPIRVESLAALGLESLRRGDVKDARAQAAKALRIARHGEFLLDDRSGLEVLVARLRYRAGKVKEALLGLEHAARSARETDIPLYVTVQLARLHMLLRDGFSRDALRVRGELISVATRLKAHRWVDKADQVVRENTPSSRRREEEARLLKMS